MTDCYFRPAHGGYLSEVHTEIWLPKFAWVRLDLMCSDIYCLSSSNLTRDHCFIVTHVNLESSFRNPLHRCDVACFADSIIFMLKNFAKIFLSLKIRVCKAGWGKYFWKLSFCLTQPVSQIVLFTYQYRS